MSRRLAPGALATASPLLLAAWLVDHPLAAWIAALVVLLFPAALIGLALGRRPPGRSPWPSAALAVLLVGCGAGLAWSGAGPGRGVLIAGLPAGTLWLLLGLGAGALVAVTAIYAATFDRFGIRRQDLERLRRWGGGVER